MKFRESIKMKQATELTLMKQKTDNREKSTKPKTDFEINKTDKFQPEQLGWEPEIKLPTSAGSQKKQESSRKTSISALLTMPKPWTVWITINYGKF